MKCHFHLIAQILVLRVLFFSLVPFCFSFGITLNIFQGSLEFARIGGEAGPFNSEFAFIGLLVVCYLLVVMKFEKSAVHLMFHCQRYGFVWF